MAWNFIYQLFGNFCSHKWETIDTVEIEEADYLGVVVANGTRYVLRCEKCGDIKYKDII